MRLLFFSNVFPNPMMPGKGTFNRSMVRALAEQHTVFVVSPVSWTDEAADRIRRLVRRTDRQPGNQHLGEFGGNPSRHASSHQGPTINHRRLHLLDGIPVEYPRFWYPPRIGRSNYHHWMWYSVRRRLQSVLESVRPDAVLAYWTHPDGAVAVRAAHKAGLPAVVMVGGTDVLVLGREERRRRAIGDVLRRADAVVAVSEHIARSLREFGPGIENVHVVRRGVDGAIFRPGNRTAARAALGLDPEIKTIVSVGRLVPVKGHAVLIEACRRLHERGLSFRCHILGDGELRTALADRIRRAGLENVVAMPGAQSQKRLADWYRAADLVVAPSFSEGIPNVLLESLACGTPFVASAVGGIPEIADQRFDRLVPAGDSAALAEALEHQLTHAPMMGRRRFEPPTWRESAAQLTVVFNECRTHSAVSKDGHSKEPAPRNEVPSTSAVLIGH